MNTKKIFVVNTTISPKEIKTCRWRGVSHEGYHSKSDYCKVSHRVMACRKRQKSKELNDVIPIEVEEQQNQMAPTTIRDADIDIPVQMDDTFCYSDNNAEKAIMKEDAKATEHPDIVSVKTPIKKDSPQFIHSDNSKKDIFTIAERHILQQVQKVVHDIEKTADQNARDGKSQIPGSLIHSLVPSNIGIDLDRPILFEKFGLKYELNKQNYLTIKL